MQKLQLKSKNIPSSVSQARRSINSRLNRDENLSVSGGHIQEIENDRLGCNNLDGNQPQQTAGPLKSFAFVLSKDGVPLMPCSSAKAKHLLKKEAAHVIKKIPFTIQLHFACENKVQPITLGIDTGYGNIGFSAKTEKQELISGTVVLDHETSDRLAERSMYRRGRRNKHHWYRAPRFNNRTKKEGWLPPSTQRRYDTHLSIINKIRAILPVDDIILEIAKFDIQKIKNPDINGVDYQRGDMFGYQNMRSYLMARENGLCQLCGEKFSRENPSHIHHIIFRSNGGTDKPDNLALLHKKCHDKHHEGLRNGLPDALKKNKQYKESTFMSIIQKKFWNDVDDMKVTFGYVTFLKRNELGMLKTHSNDAFVIANGTTQSRSVPFNITQKRRHNRGLQTQNNGKRPSIRRKRYDIQLLDSVKIGRKWFVSGGTSGEGKRVYMQGEYVLTKTGKKRKALVPTKKITGVYHVGSLVWSV